MKTFRNFHTPISVFMAVAFVYSLSSHSFYLPGMAPFSTALQGLDKRVFLKVEQDRKVSALAEAQRVKTKIWKVISEYQTGQKLKALKDIPEWIYQESKKYGYDPLLLTAMIVTESSFNNWAQSNKGAFGLMQIKLRTGHALAAEIATVWAGKPTLFDPASNIALGAFYLDKLVKRFKSMNVALEAYNHGPSRISRYLRKGQLPEDYSNKVFRVYDLIRSKSI